jgi:hypothetical protein
VVYLPSICEALGSILSIRGKKEGKTDSTMKFNNRIGFMFSKSLAYSVFTIMISKSNILISYSYLTPFGKWLFSLRQRGTYFPDLNTGLALHNMPMGPSFPTTLVAPRVFILSLDCSLSPSVKHRFRKRYNSHAASFTPLM